MRRTRLLNSLALGGVAAIIGTLSMWTPQAHAAPDYPPFEKISEGYKKVVTTADGKSLYTVWIRNKDGQMLAELPRGYERQHHFFAMTVPYGEIFAGLQGGDLFTKWVRYDKRMALVRPNVSTLATGDREAKDSVNTIFTDTVLLDIPIVCMGPGGQPVIDLDALLIGQAAKFYGAQARGMNARLVKITKAKAFPDNIEVGFEVPGAGGNLKTYSYSISRAPDKTGYKPRKADERIGYFLTTHRDLGKYRDTETTIRYINRWHLEKADPKLKMSPPKNPIVYYVHHTVPVRYRRWVRDGALKWNNAFAKVGIVDAVEVHFQDKTTGAHMEKDPEDVRYNFIRWLNNDIGTAIGPSRVDPRTGQILDADVVLTDGWIRHFWNQANEVLPDIATESFDEQTMAWLAENPDWDPRVRLAPPAERERVIAEIAASRVAAPVEVGAVKLDTMFDDCGNLACVCNASQGKAMDMAMMSMHMSMFDLDAGDGDMLDGIPEWFVGPMLADLTCHEVGHTLGLRHNFKGSSILTLEEINSDEVKGQKAFTSSIMDYTPVNINMDDGPIQGDYAMIDIGAYDYWAIEYGYTFDDPKKVASRVASSELQFATDEDTSGPDPLARRYDFSADPLDYAESTMRLVEYHRDQILDRYVKDGDRWDRARKGYEITLGQQMRAVSMMANWVGGTHVYRDRKGDPDGRPPLEPVSAEKQRAALAFVIDNTFHDDAFGLNSELLRHMTNDKLAGGFGGGAPTFPVNDRIMGIQATAMTQLLNPTTLGRVYDNEILANPDEDMITLPEMLTSIREATWLELSEKVGSDASDRNPAISNLRRNLQREYLDRTVGLTTGRGMRNAAGKTVNNLISLELRELHADIDAMLESSGKRLDRYTLAHLTEARDRIERALNAQYMRTN